MNSLLSFDDKKGLIEMLAIVEQLFEIRTGLNQPKDHHLILLYKYPLFSKFFNCTVHAHIEKYK